MDLEDIRKETLKFKISLAYWEYMSVLCTEVPENATATCNDPSNPCLFNVASDPCEYFDVSKSHPAIVKLLLNRLQFYNSTAIPPGNKPQDPRANPIFWNNTWTNWFDYLDQNSYSFVA
ncbi:Arylsulfatase J [Armadillidium nasatum]|uniref:Arylsulfatase J n=1 Tax=Armadillidium nasatum TaxID=96803 RepID=A0A5N5T5F6_9CRUS|nr:Arylsulfatase J [Armadillidium nasatum]